VDVAGRLWLAAVRTDGGVALRATEPDSAHWLPPRILGSHVAVTTSTGLVAPVAGGVRVGIAAASGQTSWRPAGATRLVTGTGPRAGAFASGLLLSLHS
jgi:hypothetical protein